MTNKTELGQKTEISNPNPHGGFEPTYMGYYFVKVKGQVNNRCDFF
jgi:hypothetical protein